MIIKFTVFAESK